MKNPWIRKNPLMSLWLSGANTVMNTARAHTNVQAKRKGTTLMTQGAKQVTDFWTSALVPKPPRKTASKRRKR